MRTAPTVFLTALVAVAVPGCGESRRAQRERTPEGVAAAFLVSTAQSGPDHEAERLADPETLAADRPGFREACDGLTGILDPRVVLVAPLPEGVAVDFVGSLPGGGRLEGSLVLRRDEEGRWRVRAVQAPGAAWPRRDPPEGEGLTVSPPP